MKKLFTSESVTEGHPDKVCDLIADSILDGIIALDPDCRAACEVCAGTDNVFILGEITSTAQIDYEAVARAAVKSVGYNSPELGFDAHTFKVTTHINRQSPDIAMGVDRDGAGDQGIMFGYAAAENEALMPMPIYLAHKLTKALSDARKSGELPFLRPDGKAQVTVEYNGYMPQKITAVVLSAQHSPDITIDELRAELFLKIIKKTLPGEMLSKNTKFHINPTGRFVIGGPHGDTGVTGRKIIADTYGGACVHGGGAFSGKDPTKVDRSASYMARYAAKSVVASGLAKRCRIDLAYAIGVAEPVAVEVFTFGTSVMPDNKIAERVREQFDFRPRAIIETLNLKTPIYAKTTNYGHFGRPGFPWEQA